MKYKSEVMVNREVLLATSSISTHPNQIIKKTINKMRDNNINNFLIYVLNDTGDRWVYTVERKRDKYNVRLMKKSYNPLTRDEIAMVFSGNALIKD